MPPVTVKRSANPLFELGLPGSITQQTLADRSQPISPSLGLPFPSAHEEPWVHLLRALPARYVPPSGFGYPLDGFLPTVPRRFCFTPAALLGFTLRSFLLPEGIHPVSGWKDPPTVSPVRIPTPKWRPAGQAAVPGFRPFRESLATRHGFNTRTAGCSPGFRPSRASTNASARISTCLLSRASPPGLVTRASAPQSLDWRPLRSNLSRGCPWGSTGTPFWGFRTGLHPDSFGTYRHPGYLVHLAPRRTSLPTVRYSLDGLVSLPELSGSAEVPRGRSVIQALMSFPEGSGSVSENPEPKFFFF
jgi:hypothetical protein